MSEQGNKPTIVFAHGAWCDASVWTKTLMPLAHEGFPIRCAQLPLESYEGDVAALNALLDQVTGPVLLVGHSYAGAVISNAGNHQSVKALAYVAAFAPEDGEVFGSLMAMNPAEEPLTIAPDRGGFLWLSADFVAAGLGYDLHRGLINLLVATQKPTSASLFQASLTNSAWKTKPSSYLVTTGDKTLAPATQHVLAKRIGARVEEVSSSHLVPLSQPEAVTEFVRNSLLAM